MLVSICLAIIFCTIVIDQITKIVFWNISKPLIGDVVWLTSTLNDGAAFSMMKGGRIFFILFSIIALFALGYVLIARKVSTAPFFRFTISMLIGGIIGNFIDRFLWGYVRDFIYIKPLGFVCNVADIFICLATFFIVIYILFMHDFDHSKNKRTNIKTQKEN